MSQQAERTYFSNWLVPPETLHASPKIQSPAASYRLSKGAQPTLWFGLDVGPFVKPVHYATRRGRLDGRFVVKDSVSRLAATNCLVAPFDRLARLAPCVPRPGGTSMRGSQNMLVRMSRNAFDVLDAQRMDGL